MILFSKKIKTSIGSVNLNIIDVVTGHPNSKGFYMVGHDSVSVTYDAGINKWIHELSHYFMEHKADEIHEHLTKLGIKIVVNKQLSREYLDEFTATFNDWCMVEIIAISRDMLKHINDVRMKLQEAS